MSKLLLLENFSLHYPNMRIGRFTLKAGEKIPIHIHMNQFGLAYLLKGKCVLSTYAINMLDNERFQLILDNKQTLTENTYSILTPKINAHQIEVVEDSIFLDIFAPGSSEGKLSDYLEIILSEDNDSRLIGRKISMENAELPESLKENMGNFIEIASVHDKNFVKM